MKKAIGKNGSTLSLGLLFSTIILVLIGLLIFNIREQDNRIEQLEIDNGEMYQELIETRDILKQISMRNEAIEEIKDFEESGSEE